MVDVNMLLHTAATNLLLIQIVCLGCVNSVAYLSDSLLFNILASVASCLQVIFFFVCVVTFGLKCRLWREKKVTFGLKLIISIFCEGDF